MGLFGKKKTAPSDPSLKGWGRALVVQTFEAPLRDELLATIEPLSAAFPSRVGARLADQLVASGWVDARSAASALRKEGVRGLPALPALAAWVRRGVHTVPDDYAAYGMREAVSTLHGWRDLVAQHMARQQDEASVALQTLSAFCDGPMEAIAAELLLGPNLKCCRGAIPYLRGAKGNPDAALQALETWLDRTPSDGTDADLQYARSEAMQALQELAGRLEVQPISRAAAAAPRTSPRETAQAPLPPLRHPAADPQDPQTAGPIPPAYGPAALAQRLVIEVGQGSPNVRLAAIQGLQRLRTPPAGAAQAVFALLGDPRLQGEAWERVRISALQYLSAQPEHRAQTAPGPRPAALAQLSQLAQQDPAPEVRASALDTLCQSPTLPADIDALVAGALSDAHPLVRQAAVRLLGRLTR